MFGTLCGREHGGEVFLQLTNVPRDGNRGKTKIFVGGLDDDVVIIVEAVDCGSTA